MRRLLPAVALFAMFPLPAAAQSLLYRAPNLSGTWTPDGGVVFFNFAHRFYVQPASGKHKVSNFPTFTVAVGPVRDLAIGMHYSSNSQLVPQAVEYRPNETEFYARFRWLGGPDGMPGVAAAFTAAYNRAARSFDSELSADYTRGRVTLSGAVRYIGTPFGLSDGADVALAGGLVARLNDFVGVTADYAKMLDHDTTAAWSAGLVFLIPGSPHTFSLHASKALSNTIQSSSYGGEDVLYGFEFTIPLHLSRFAPWFGGRGRRGVVPPPADLAADVEITSFRYRHDTVYVSVGRSVRWINADPVEHTVTFDGGQLEGSAALATRDAFVVRFDRPGTYTYHCTPHTYMKGVVVVR